MLTPVSSFTKRHLGITLVFVMLLLAAGMWVWAVPGPGGPASVETPERPQAEMPAPLWTKERIRDALAQVEIQTLIRPSATLALGNTEYVIQTSINPDLQDYLERSIDARYAKFVGIVVMQPDTGQVMAMAGYADPAPEADNPCLASRYPAASLFKIVTAAAAIEKFGYTDSSGLTYNGGKYTLYKSQLKEQTNRHTQKTTLGKSFGESINPVFGKLGALYLKKEVLEDYADAFGFNQEFLYELPLEQSVVAISDDPYHWAEIASGFNRETMISPLHGAMIASVVVNGGVLVEPSLVQRVTDGVGREVYAHHPAAVKQSVRPETAATLKQMMAVTVTQGTSRKTFLGRNKDRVLSRLKIGGKTGSISSRQWAGVRYDWFAGYALDEETREAIAVSIVVAHNQYIGIRASEYAKMAMRRYFGAYFSGHANPDGKS